MLQIHVIQEVSSFLFLCYSYQLFALIFLVWFAAFSLDLRASRWAHWARWMVDGQRSNWQGSDGGGYVAQKRAGVGEDDMSEGGLPEPGKRSQAGQECSSGS